MKKTVKIFKSTRENKIEWWTKSVWETRMSISRQANWIWVKQTKPLEIISLRLMHLWAWVGGKHSRSFYSFKLILLFFHFNFFSLLFFINGALSLDKYCWYNQTRNTEHSKKTASTRKRMRARGKKRALNFTAKWIRRLECCMCMQRDTHMWHTGKMCPCIHVMPSSPDWSNYILSKNNQKHSV